MSKLSALILIIGIIYLWFPISRSIRDEFTEDSRPAEPSAIAPFLPVGQAGREHIPPDVPPFRPAAGHRRRRRSPLDGGARKHGEGRS
jgi:hypothetical protein